jgi:hypothetical protein
MPALFPLSFGVLRWHQPNLSQLLLLGSLNCLEGTIRFSSLSYWVRSGGFQSLVCCLNEQDETLNPHQTPSRHENLQHVSKVHLSRRARPIASVMALGNGTKGPLDRALRRDRLPDGGYPISFRDGDVSLGKFWQRAGS